MRRFAARVRPSGGPVHPERAMPDPSRALRAEHDDLARRLAVRRSIDVMRRFAYTAFAAFITAGLSAKLAYDRWFSIRPTRFKGPPIYFFVALAVTIVLVVVGAVLITRARRLMRAEDELFARMRTIRD